MGFGEKPNLGKEAAWLAATGEGGREGGSGVVRVGGQVRGAARCLPQPRALIRTWRRPRGPSSLPAAPSCRASPATVSAGPTGALCRPPDRFARLSPPPPGSCLARCSLGLGAPTWPHVPQDSDGLGAHCTPHTWSLGLSPVTGPPAVGTGGGMWRKSAEEDTIQSSGWFLCYPAV
jgi:hypothetical protein